MKNVQESGTYFFIYSHPNQPRTYETFPRNGNFYHQTDEKTINHS